MAGPVSRTYTYDATGNVLSDGSTTYTWDPEGRLGSSERSNATYAYTYKYNGFGELIIKRRGSSRTPLQHFYIYDTVGHLISEYSGYRSGRDYVANIERETVWLDDIPIAVLTRPVTTGLVQVSYIHVDHLNTPMLIVDSTNTPIWRWDNTQVFGSNLPDEDPDGDSNNFEYNLRFAGQYFDKETGLHYNFFRDYDPETGRYILSKV